MAEPRIPRWIPASFRPDAYLSRVLRREFFSHLRQAGLCARSKVVDLGSGSQPYRECILGAGAEYVACDIGRGRHVEIVEGVPLDLPVGHFDLGISAQVLEHVWDIDEYLGRFHRHVRPGGRIVLSTHGVWIYHPHPTDFRRWTRSGLCKELESRGLLIERVSAVLGPLAWTTQIRSLGISYVLLRFGMPGAVVSLFTSAIMNLRIWIEDSITPGAVADDNACIYILTARVPNPAE
jgi:SAM-dependent methyltransferase